MPARWRCRWQVDAGSAYMSKYFQGLIPTEITLPALASTSGTDGGALRGRPGVLALTNGIALLAERGFGSGIEDNAGKLFEWLNGYVAHPVDCPGKLAEGAGRVPVPLFATLD